MLLPDALLLVDVAALLLASALLDAISLEDGVGVGVSDVVLVSGGGEYVDVVVGGGGSDVVGATLEVVVDGSPPVPYDQEPKSGGAPRSPSAKNWKSPAERSRPPIGQPSHCGEVMGEWRRERGGEGRTRSTMVAWAVLPL